MAGSEVERNAPVTVACFGGVRALLPTGRTAAERPARHARRTGRVARWALRSLVVGGLAGAAWLLSGAAAHAATPEAPVAAPLGGLSVVSIVKDVDADAVRHRIERPAAKPAPVTAVANGVLDDPAAVVSDVARKAVRIDPVRLSHSLTDRTSLTDRVSAASSRLVDGPATAHEVIVPITEPVRSTLRPVADLLQRAVEPVTTVRLPALVRLPDAVRTPDRGPVQPPATVAAPASPAAVSSLPAGDPADVESATDRRAVPAQHRAGESAPVPGKPAQPAELKPTEPAELLPAPDQPEQAPGRGHLGAVGGFPTSASHAPSDGGHAAIGTSSVNAATVDDHRLRTATDVGLRRFDAEAPTVSPD